MGEYNNYSFKIDGGLHTFARAMDRETAEKRVTDAWPRSKIEFIGVNMPAAERRGHVPNMATATKVKPTTVSSAPKDRIDDMSDKLGMTETEASLVANMA